MIKIAIDANEANVTNRVGSNVYAYELLCALEQLTREGSDYEWTILVREQPVADLPVARPGWQYQVITPRWLWTQLALPIHLFVHQTAYDVFFTPGHYAPRLCPIPYVSSVMDVAYHYYPDQFQSSDLIQLAQWTRYSVKRAQHVIAISEATKQDVIKLYHKPAEQISVVYPAVTPLPPPAPSTATQFFKRWQIRQPYFLFIGTFQPRKNLLRLIEAYEQLCRQLLSQQTKKTKLPQLVLAGKIGWLADDITQRIKQSPFYDFIITPGFVTDQLKPALYAQAVASVLVGLYEGFGLPPLESLHYGCLPIVSNTTSLPEVVGAAGILVDATSATDIGKGLHQALTLTAKQRAQLLKKGRDQIKNFSWSQSAQQVLHILKEVAQA